MNQLCHKVIKVILYALSSSVSLCSLLGHEGLEVVNPEGGQEDVEEEAIRGRFKQEVTFIFMP